MIFRIIKIAEKSRIIDVFIINFLILELSSVFRILKIKFRFQNIDF
jgi:hypothetical protein